MTVIPIVLLSPPWSARADERAVPASLIERGLRQGGFCESSVSDRALAAAQWVPELRLGLMVRLTSVSWGSSAETLVFGQLAWPLGRAPIGDAIRAGRDIRQRSAARDSLVERIATAWHKRQRADELSDEIAARLAADEADAELEALTGDESEDAP